MRYEMTARENIAVGRVEVKHNPEEIEYAAEKSLAGRGCALPAVIRPDAWPAF
jgi:hypothetical protein